VAESGGVHHIVITTLEALRPNSDALSGADFGISFVVNMAQILGQLEPYPKLAVYLERNQSRPAFARAKERAVE
jgi:hypothetical protein